MLEKRKIVLISLGILLFLSIMLGSSYAVWQITKTQEGKNIVSSKCFNVIMKDETNGIALNKVIPTTEEEGKKEKGYSFTIKNVCDTNAFYQVNLEELQTDLKRLSNEYIRVSLNDSKGKILNTYKSVSKTIEEADISHQLTSGSLKPDEEVTYELKLWLDENTPAVSEVMEATFLSKVSVIATYKENLENELDLVAESQSEEYSKDFEVFQIRGNSEGYAIIEVSEDGRVYNSIEPTKAYGIEKKYEKEGTYSYFIRDELGHEKEVVIKTTKLDQSSPEIKTRMEHLQEKILLHLEISDAKSGVDSYAIVDQTGKVRNALKPTSWIPYEKEVETEIDENGLYYIWAKDKVGNETYEAFTAKEIDKEAPTLSVKSFLTSWGEKDKFILHATDDLIGISGISVTKTEGTYEWVTVENNPLEYDTEVEVLENGTYYVSVKDAYNHITTKAVEITYIDSEAPTNSGYEIKNISPSGFDIYVKNVVDEGLGGVRVEFAVWAKENNDEVVRKAGTLQEDGKTWFFHVDTREHNNSSGVYHAQVFLYDQLNHQDQFEIDEVSVLKVSVTFDQNYLENNLLSETYDATNYISIPVNIFSASRIEDETSITGQSIKIEALENTGTGVYFIKNTPLEVGKTYTVSVYVKSNVTKQIAVNHEQDKPRWVTVNSEWQKFTYTFVASDRVNKAIVFYKMDNQPWNAGEELYIHSLELKEGSPSVTTEEKNYNQVIGSLQSPTRDGYIFQGWFTDPVGGEQIDSLSKVPSSNTTYYAHWKSESISSFTFEGVIIEEGRFGWNKRVDVKTNFSNTSNIKEYRYCITTDDTCAPTTKGVISNSTFTVSLDSNSSSQKVCGQITSKTGTLSSVECSARYFVDHNPPVISSVTNPSNGNWTNQNFSLQIHVTDTERDKIDYCYYSYDNVNFTRNAGTYANGIFTNTPNEAERNQLEYIKCYDYAGNESNVVSTWIRIDKTGPNISSISATTEWAESNTITAQVQDTSSGLVGYAWTTSSATPTSYTTITSSTAVETLNYNTTSNGTYYLHTKDALGNTSYKSININRVDRTKPVAVISAKDAREGRIVVDASGSYDARSGIKTYQYSLDNTNWYSSTSSIYTFTGINPGNYTIYVRTIDLLNHVSDVVSDTITMYAVYTFEPFQAGYGDNTTYRIYPFETMGRCDSDGNCTSDFWNYGIDATVHNSTPSNVSYGVRFHISKLNLVNPVISFDYSIEGASDYVGFSFHTNLATAIIENHNPGTYNYNAQQNGTVTDIIFEADAYSNQINQVTVKNFKINGKSLDDYVLPKDR